VSAGHTASLSTATSGCGISSLASLTHHRIVRLWWLQESYRVTPSSSASSSCHVSLIITTQRPLRSLDVNRFVLHFLLCYKRLPPPCLCHELSPLGSLSWAPMAPTRKTRRGRILFATRSRALSSWFTPPTCSHTTRPISLEAPLNESILPSLARILSTTLTALPPSSRRRRPAQTLLQGSTCSLPSRTTYRAISRILRGPAQLSPSQPQLH
jgi:hypothetical protein